MSPFLTAIAGPSCSGKTRLAQTLAAELGAARTTVVGLDSYYRDLANISFEERERRNFDLPDALDSDLLSTQVTALARGQAIEQPVYDFATHTRSVETVRVVPTRFIIIEGLFALYWRALRELYGLQIFIGCDDSVCLARRLARDTCERGRSRESVVQQYEQSVRPMMQRCVNPTERHADLVLDGTAPLAEQTERVIAHLGPHIS